MIDPGVGTHETKLVLDDDCPQPGPDYFVAFLQDELDQTSILFGFSGSSKKAREEVLRLVEAADLIGWDAGPIENSVVVEGLTSVLININRIYGSKHSGIKITGVPKRSGE